MTGFGVVYDVVDRSSCGSGLDYICSCGCCVIVDIDVEVGELMVGIEDCVSNFDNIDNYGVPYPCCSYLFYFLSTYVYIDPYFPVPIQLVVLSFLIFVF